MTFSAGWLRVLTQRRVNGFEEFTKSADCDVMTGLLCGLSNIASSVIPYMFGTFLSLSFQSEHINLRSEWYVIEITEESIIYQNALEIHNFTNSIHISWFLDSNLSEESGGRASGPHFWGSEPELMGRTVSIKTNKDSHSYIFWLQHDVWLSESSNWEQIHFHLEENKTADGAETAPWTSQKTKSKPYYNFCC